MNTHGKSSRGRLRTFASILWGLALCLGVTKVFGPAPVMAQSAATGAVAGLVKDQQGAPVPGAEVQLTDLSTNAPRITATNDAGRYSFNSIPPATYDLTVTKPSFALAKVKDQTVEVGQALTLDVELAVGATTTTVEVTASAGAELQTNSATVGSTLSGDSLLLLPNLGRDATSLATLQVGVTPGGQVAGTQSDQGAFHLDGGNNSDDMAGNYSTYTTSNGGGPSGVAPTPVESMEEFKVGITNQTADFNGAGGSQVQMVTKRGTNEFHGALYDYFFATNVGAANSWKNDHTPSGRSPYTPLAEDPPEPLRCSSGRSGRCRNFWAEDIFLLRTTRATAFPTPPLSTGPCPPR